MTARGMPVGLPLGTRANFPIRKIRNDSDQDVPGHNIVLPPLTLMTCPVTNEASFDAR